MNVLNPQAGRSGFPPLKRTGCSNNNTAANSRLSTWGFNQLSCDTVDLVIIANYEAVNWNNLSIPLVHVPA